jgi:hypothetical protein
MKVFVKSHLGGYTVSREWVMEEYKNHLLLKRRLAKRPPTKKQPVDLDNSEPWMENPKTIDDLVWIAQQVNKTAETCKRP